MVCLVDVYRLGGLPLHRRLFTLDTHVDTPMRLKGGFDPSKGAIRLTVNGEIKQDADLAELIWPVEDIVAFASKLWKLEAGDLIYTGTPAGVGAVVEGDEIVVTIDGLSPLNVKIGPKAD